MVFKKQDEMEDNPLFDFMKDLRNRVAHPNDTYLDPREWPGVKTWPIELDEPPQGYEEDDRVKNVSTTGYEFVRYSEDETTAGIEGLRCAILEEQSIPLTAKSALTTQFVLED